MHGEFFVKKHIVDPLKKSIERLRRARDYAQAIFESTRHPKVVLDNDLRMRQANRAFHRFFGLGAKEIKNQPLADVCGGKLNIPLVRSLLDKVQRNHAQSRDIEIDVTLRKGGKRTLLLHACRIRIDSDEPAGVLLTLEDISERLQAQEALELRSRAAMQREFITNVSHELRTPVSAIEASAESLLRAVDDPLHQKQFVKIIQQHARRLSRIIEDVIKLSSLETGRRKAQPQKIALPGFVDELVHQLQPLAESKEVHISHKVESGMSVWFDKAHLHTILESVCENAILYNKPNGRVRIVGKTLGDKGTLTVRDTGHGISVRDMPRVFERFYRGERSRSSSGGLGLGLPIAKALAEANSSSLSLASFDGKGTAVVLALHLLKRR